MSNQVYTRSRISIQYADTPLGTPGNEGSVHQVVNTPRYEGYCVKIYHKPKRDAGRLRKIEYMVNNPPDDLKTENFIICWPVDILVDDKGAFMGFLMPLGFASSIKLYELVTPRLNPGFAGKQWEKFERTIQTGFEYRMKICVNIAIAVHNIHRMAKYVIVDYKPQNILISNTGKISMLDVDSFQIAEGGKLLFNAGALTPEYAPPESQYHDPSRHYIAPEWDLFSMAISFYQLLYGLHPYAGTPQGQYATSSDIGEKIRHGLFVHGGKQDYLAFVPPLHANFHRLPEVLKRLFIRAFDSPDKRPTARDWGSAISSALGTGMIKPNTITVKTSRQPPPRQQTPPPARAATPPPVSRPAMPTPVPIKKNYMPYKIASFILAIIVVVMYYRWQGATERLNGLNQQMTENNSRIEALSGVQQVSEGAKIKLEESRQNAQNLERTLDGIGSHYPITVTGISFNNELYDNGIPRVIMADRTVFSASDLQYIAPVLKFRSNVKRDTTLTIYYDLMGPENTFIQSSVSPSEYTYSGSLTVPGGFRGYNSGSIKGFHLPGDANKGVVDPGKYKINIWCNNMMIAQGAFEITQ